MTRKQIAHLIREQRPEPPEGYEAHIERKLDSLMKEDMIMKRRYKVSTMLLAAALVTLALAGAALAARELKLFSAPHGALVSSDGTEDRVVTGLGSAENELVRVTVEEALYDGKTIAALISIVPQNPEGDAMLGYADSWTDSNDVYDLDILEADGVGTQYRLLGRKDGKRIITFGSNLLVNGDVVEEMAADVLGDGKGGEQIWLRYGLEELGDNPVIHCELRALTGVFGDDGNRQTLSVSFDLSRVADERTFEIVPIGDGTGERFEILRGYITFAKAMTYMTLDYSYTQGPGEEMGIDFRLFDADENLIDADNGFFDELGGNDWRLIDELEAVENIPETIILEAKVIGEDRTLGRVECQLVETDVIELPEVPEQAIVQPTHLMPKGSWVSDHMRLLFVELHEESGLVSVMFACDGGAEAAGKIRFTLLDASGQPMELKTILLDHEGNPKETQVFSDSGEGFCNVLMAVRDSAALSGQIAIEARMGEEENLLGRFEGTVTNADSSTGDVREAALVRLPVNPAFVFIADDDDFYHTRPNCASGEPRGVALEAALNMGKTACLRCCESAE